MRDRPSLTAEVVCFIRALDHRSDVATRLLVDPFAASFLRAPARMALGAGRLLPAALVDYVRARHRYMDDALLAALPSVHQVVVVGAGYDARAWRHAAALGDTPWFEVDHPATAQRKARCLARVQGWPGVDRRVVAVDLRHERLDVALERSGFRRGLATFFVWEGVSMYLSREAVAAALAGFADLGGPGSRLVADWWTIPEDPGWSGTVERFTPALLGLIGEPFLFAVHPADCRALLGAAGWSLADTADAEVLARRYLAPGRRSYETAYVVEAVRAVEPGSGG